MAVDEQGAHTRKDRTSLSDSFAELGRASAIGPVQSSHATDAGLGWGPMLEYFAPYTFQVDAATHFSDEFELGDILEGVPFVEDEHGALDNGGASSTLADNRVVEVVGIGFEHDEHLPTDCNGSRDSMKGSGAYEGESYCLCLPLSLFRYTHAFIRST